MIIEWRLSDGSINFGDGISQVLINCFTPKDKANIIHSQSAQYFLVGSYISDSYISRLAKSQTAYFWGCGFRGKTLRSPSIDKCNFHGVRGLETKKYLSKLGIEVPVIGDTALALPVLVKKEKYTKKRIFMPHAEDPNRLNYKPSDIGVDEILQPNVSNTADVINIIKALSAADFVLAGAMHAGIVAHAYGVPFCFFKSIDSGARIKYKDFLSAITPSLEPKFAKDINEARQWYNTNKLFLRPISVRKILKSAPYKIRKELMLKAYIHDIKERFSGK